MTSRSSTSTMKAIPVHSLQARGFLVFARSEFLFDRRRDFEIVRSEVRLKPRDRMPVEANQERAAVRLDFAARLSIGGVSGQERIGRSFVVAFDRNLGHHGERDVECDRTECPDSLIGCRLRAAEIVSREADDYQAAIPR